jgi:hypothetical protein
MTFSRSRPGRAQALSAALATTIALGLLILSPPTFAQGQAKSGIRGRITDKRSGKPIVTAPVLFQSGGQLQNTVTNDAGLYQAALPPGTYTVRSYFDLYHGAKVTNVVVREGEVVDLSLTLTRIDEDRDVAVQEMEIPYRADTTTAAAQDQLRQAGSGIGEGMGAKQMSQAGASDAGSAAARVVGVSIESSQLVIRGLGGRYTRVLLNGIPVPSIDPDVPGADLDLFPTSVIDSLTVSKTFLPDMPADFAGGVMEIKSISFPRQFTLELGLSGGLDSQSTFRERLDYRGGKYDVFGFDDGRRDLPDTVSRTAPLRSPSPAYPDQQRLNEASRAFRNSWQYRYKSALPKMGVDLTHGNSLRLGGRKRFGYLVTAGYEYDSVRRLALSRPNPSVGADGTLTEFHKFAVEKGTDEVQLSALATASLDVGVDHSMTVLSLFNRTVSDETIRRTGTYEGSGYQEKWQLQYLARALWFNQLFGDHRNLLGTRLRLRWAGFHAYARRDEPDRRTVAYGGQGPSRSWTDQGGSGDRIYSNLRQDDVGANLSLRFPLWPQAWGTVGGTTQLSTRDFGTRRIRIIKNQQNPDGTVYGRDIEDILRPDQVGSWTEMTEDVRPNDNYESRQTLYSGHVLLETPLIGPLSLAGGLRTEILTQKVESRSPFEATAAATTKRTDRTDVDYLPGAALKYQLSGSMLLRAAYGVTVARPQVRELAPYQYYDFLRDRGVEGNPDLKRTLIQNADLRWEWFFGEGEIASVSGFYKSFADPIELVILDSITGGSQYRNGTSARNLGTEVELRLGLGRLARPLRLFSLDGNFAVIQSRIDLGSEKSAVQSGRRLLGQAPYVANLSLRLFEPNRGVTASIVYNVVGPRIVDVGISSGGNFLPNIEEQAFHSLDLVASAPLGKHLKLKLKIKNLLMQATELMQGSFLIQRIEPGLSGSLGVTLLY